jgi:hypothetical protein
MSSRLVQWSVMALLFTYLPGSIPASEKKPLELRWDQLGPVIETHWVQVSLDDGRKIDGRVSSVLAGAMVLKTGSGMEHIPRTSIVGLSVAGSGKKWRLIGAAIGFYAVATSISAGSKYGGEALQGPPALAAYAGGIAGYFIGRSSDRRFREIRILP